MTYKDLIQPHIENLPVYKPGKPLEYVAKEYGLEPDNIHKLASNENPLGAPPSAIAAMTKAMKEVNLYPDGECCMLREQLAIKLGIEEGQLVFGNGSNEVIELFAHVFGGPGVEAVMGVHSFPVYKIVTMLMGAVPVEIPMPDYRHDIDAMLDAVTDRTRMLFLPSPNNPTGTCNTAEEIYHLVESLPEHVTFLFDEAYVEFFDNPPDLRPYIAQGKKILCTRTFSKIYGLAGLRIGYAYGSEELISILNKAREPFNVNRLAQVAALAALEDDAFVNETRRVNSAGLKQLIEGFNALGLDYVPSEANFILVDVKEAKSVFTFLQSRGVIVRPALGISPAHVRVSVGNSNQNSDFLKYLEEFLASLNS